MHKKTVSFIYLIGMVTFLCGCATSHNNAASQSERNNGGVGLPIHGNFCGPNIPTTQSKSLQGQLDELQRIQPIDDIDKACKSHDLCYAKRGFGDKDCDLDLINTVGNLAQRSTDQSKSKKNINPISFQCEALAISIIAYFQTSNPTAVKGWTDKLVGNAMIQAGVGYAGLGLKAYEYTYKTLFLVYYPVLLLINGSFEKTNEMYKKMYSKWDWGAYAGRWEKCNY